MYACARIVHVRYATVHLSDLPAAFDGTTVLFVSDFDMRSEAGAREAARLMQTLSALEPDILLLGGDYASPTLLDALEGRDAQSAGVASRAVGARHAFFAALESFYAPFGKFAVAGEDDVATEQLASSMALGGVRLLTDESVRIERDGASLYVAGLSPSGDAARAAETVRAQDCVIAFAHSPNRFTQALTAEADGGGAWADAILAGGTHGGQIRLGNRFMLSLDEHERRYLSGWRKEGGVFLLTSQGLGCEVVSLRLGTRAEAHLVTLRCAQGAVGGA